MSDSEKELKLDGLSIETPATSAIPASGGSINPDSMHDLFEGSVSSLSDAEDPLAQLRNDPNYSALIRDLQYIVTQARLLFVPSEETPSDGVWDKIQSQLPARPEET